MNFWQNLPKPFTVLAPMEDVTDYVFREIIAEITKPDVFFTEFTSADALFSKGRDKVIRSLLFSDKQHPIVAQIWGINPENYFKSAQLINELKFDGIDLNMGCPDKAVNKKKAGAALINSPNLAKELIQAVREGAGEMPVSVKTRIGFDEIVTNDWITFLLSQKIDALTVHGRIATEMSKGFANWEEIGRVVKIKKQISPRTIIIGNGDVKSYQEVLDKSQQYNLDGIMIGRGIFSNPWIFQKEITPMEQVTREYLNLLLKHTKLFTEKWGSEKSFGVMKKFFKMYVTNFAGAVELRQELMKCDNYAQVKDFVINSKYYK